MLQSDNQVQPIVLDFDANENMLGVVDSGFILFVDATPNADLLSLVASRRGAGDTDG